MCVKLLVQLLALQPDAYVELAAGGPHPGDVLWDDPALVSEAKDAGGEVAGGEGGVKGVRKEAGGVQFPIMIESAALYMREHRMWRASRVAHVHLKPTNSMPAALKTRCRGRGKAMDMCRNTISPHNVKQVLMARGITQGKSPRAKVLF